MSDTPFKTPIHPRSRKADYEKASDSDESTTSTETTESTGSNAEISIVAEFDELMRIMKMLKTDKFQLERAFLDLIEQTKEIYKRNCMAEDECQRLQNLLDSKIHECSDLENKLCKARKLLDQERRNTRNAEKERDDLASQIESVREFFAKDTNNANKLSDETREKLPFLHNIQYSNWENNNHQPQLSAIKEVNSTGSILSDFSYSRSEDDLDESLLQKGKSWKKHRPSSGGVQEPATKKRRSSTSKAVEINNTDTVRATTTLTVTKDGPIKATSIIESVPKTPVPTIETESTTNTGSIPSAPPANLVFESWARETPAKPERKLNCRQHVLQQRNILITDNCSICEKKIRFGKVAIKCKECRAICHLECKDRLPLPCIPTIHTPNQRNALGVIGDYTPTIPPMVPGLLIHCINEIELRGMNEVGIYRVPGSERDVKALKDKFLRGKGAPCLDQTDIHVLCSTVKFFLRSLNESIITFRLWPEFTKAITANTKFDINRMLYEAIDKLPQPNRDTLAYLIIHLQKVADAKDCKMPIENLAKTFGPTIVGYSCEEPDPNNIYTETSQQVIVMEYLMQLPRDYWSKFIDVQTLQPSNRLQQTPSTDSLLRTTNRSFFTPNRQIKRKQKYFATPPTDR